MERAKSMKSVINPSKVFVNSNRPSPYDFVTFVPWACKEYEVDVIVRSVFNEAKNASAKKKETSITKKSKSMKSVSVKDEKTDSSSSVNVLDAFVHDTNKIEVTAIFDHLHNLLSLQFMNIEEVPRTVFQVIALIIKFYPTLTSLIANRGLNAYSIHEITQLIDLSSISEVCLDGTHIKNPNYYKLLEIKSNLNCLSLAKCQIDDKMIEKIAENLAMPHPSAKTLTFLNVSSNRITDTGAAHLADALKTNRQLAYLNLADNRLTDTGVSQIFDMMLAFPIPCEELEQVKASRKVYLEKKNKLFHKYVIQLKNTEETKPMKRKVSAKSLLANSKSPKLGKKTEDLFAIRSLKSLTTVKMTTLDVLKYFDRAESLALRAMGAFDHPFDSCFVKDDTTYCKGNNTLTCLNLAFNSLSYNSVQKLKQVLNYQKNNQQTPRGLLRVRLEGNYIPSTCEEYIEINELLDLALEASTKKLLKFSKGTNKK